MPASIAASSQSSVFLRHTVSNNNDDDKDYVSPFRSQLTTVNKKQMQMAKTTKFPTVSATSEFNKRSVKDLGFNKIKSNQPRIKDIMMPQLLIDNENRQFTALKDLDSKENNLKQLRNSQHITDLCANPSKKVNPPKLIEPKSKDPRKNKINNFAIDYDFSPPVEEKVELPPMDRVEHDYMEDAMDIPISRDNDIYSIATEKDLELKANIELNNIKDAKDMILENNCKFKKPLDPSLAPKVYFNVDTNTNDDKLILTNPQATPENKEFIYKIPKYGYVSKAVYDQVNYNDMLNLNKINDLKSKYHIREEQKKQLAKDKITKINNDKLATLQKINELKLNHINNLETIENEKIFKLFKINGTNISNKYEILHSTELLKQWKLNQLKFQRQRQALLQSQLNELIVESTKIGNDYQIWNEDLVVTMEQLDAQIFKLKQCNYKQDQLNLQINKLNESKQKLQDEIDKNINANEQNKTNVNDITLGKHDYNIKLTNLEKEINEKHNLMSIIKQEIANENLNLMTVTNEIELAKQKREDEWNEKLNLNTTMFETQLKDKQDELTKTLDELKLKHDQQLQELEESYTQQLEISKKKFDEENKAHELAQNQISTLTESKMNLEDNIKELKETNMVQITKLNTTNEEIKNKLNEQTKLTSKAQEAKDKAEKLKNETEIKMNYANELLQEKLKVARENSPINNIPKPSVDDSVYSMITEEEIVYK
ncbi:hypothetical protein MOUN0_N10616 [Monosporozyma unispora]|nr:hypothetical protein C6P44_004239 [Kazachstania unispora]